jgi:hypothetical protein
MSGVGCSRPLDDTLDAVDFFSEHADCSFGGGSEEEWVVERSVAAMSSGEGGSDISTGDGGDRVSPIILA